MRTSLILVTAWLCTGCASQDRDVTKRNNPTEPTTKQALEAQQVPDAAPAEASAAPAAAPEAVPATDAETASEVQPITTADKESEVVPAAAEVAESALPPPAAPAPLPVSPPAMSKEEISTLVQQLVSEELAKRQPLSRQLTAAQAQDLAERQRAAAEAAQAAQVAEQQAQEMAAQRAAAEAAAAQRDDEALARFLLLPAELDRVDRVKTKLETDSIWSLTLQDLDFAAQGFAAPLLHDALFAAAERCDENIEMDVLARDAKFTPAEKIQLATMPPIERQQLLMFTEQLEKGQKTAAADRYIREYIVRYPFIRKMVLEQIHKEQPLP